MQGPQAGREGSPFLRVLIGHASPQTPEQAEAMSDMNKKVSKEMAGRQAKGLQDLQDVDFFPKCEVSLNLLIAILLLYLIHNRIKAVIRMLRIESGSMIVHPNRIK